MLFVYNTTSKKLTKFEGQGLSVRGSRITGYDVCEEKTLTDIKLLDRLIKGGNIIANGFMDELRTKSKTPDNNLVNKNCILLKVVK